MEVVSRFHEPVAICVCSLPLNSFFLHVASESVPITYKLKTAFSKFIKHNGKLYVPPTMTVRSTIMYYVHRTDLQTSHDSYN